MALDPTGTLYRAAVSSAPFTRPGHQTSDVALQMVHLYVRLMTDAYVRSGTSNLGRASDDIRQRAISSIACGSQDSLSCGLWHKGCGCTLSMSFKRLGTPPP